MQTASIIASKLAVGCIVLAIVICTFVALSNVDILLKNADEWEEGE